MIGLKIYGNGVYGPSRPTCKRLFVITILVSKTGLSELFIKLKLKTGNNDFYIDVPKILLNTKNDSDKLQHIGYN